MIKLIIYIKNVNNIDYNFYINNTNIVKILCKYNKKLLY